MRYVFGLIGLFFWVGAASATPVFFHDFETGAPLVPRSSITGIEDFAVFPGPHDGCSSSFEIVEGVGFVGDDGNCASFDDDNQGPLVFHRYKEYQITHKGTAKLVITLNDDDGVLPERFVINDLLASGGIWRDLLTCGYTGAEICQNQLNFFIGIGPGWIDDIKISLVPSRVPTPNPFMLVAPLLLFLGIVQLRRQRSCLSRIGV